MYLQLGCKQGVHKRLKALFPTLWGRSGNDGSYSNLFNFKSIVTWFYTQSMPSDIYALSRTRGLYGATFHPHASCMSQTHTATCMELRIGFLSRHPPPFPTSSHHLPNPDETLTPTSFHYPLPPIPRKRHLHSVPSYAMENWN